MNGSVAVILPAAGRSTRFGGPVKKPFVLLHDVPIWLHSARLFWERTDVAKVYLVIAADAVDEFRSQHADVIAGQRIEVVPGGEERFDSVASALNHVPASVEFVAVHDAVRPLTAPSLISEVFGAARDHGAAILGYPVADTLKKVEAASNRIVETLPRAGNWAAQTPQVFRRDWLIEAYGRRGSLESPITDDAQLVEAIGHPVHVVRGSSHNFKVTTPEDLELAEALLNRIGC